MYIHDHSYMHARVSVSVLVYEGLDEVWACAGFGADVFGRLQQAACLAGRSLGEKPEPRAFHITPSKNPPRPPTPPRREQQNLHLLYLCLPAGGPGEAAPGGLSPRSSCERIAWSLTHRGPSLRWAGAGPGPGKQQAGARSPWYSDRPEPRRRPRRARAKAQMGGLGLPKASRSLTKR